MNLLQQAVDLHRSGRLDEAVRGYKKVLRNDGRAVAALNLLGLAEFQRGNLREAADALSRAVRLSPDLPNIDYNLGRVLQAQGRLDDALPHYQKAVAKAPHDVEALSNLGTVLAALGRHDEAIAQYQRAVAINPHFADGWHNLGNALTSAGRYEEALAAFQKVLALRPEHAPALDSIVLVLDRLDRPADAIAYCRRAIAVEPNAPNHHTDLANALRHLGRDDDAKAEYGRALTLDPTSSGAMWNKALFLLSLGCFSEAWPLYDHRWKADRLNATRREYTQSQWMGDRVDGTLLVWPEQGLGDQILMCSMVADARNCADALVLEVEPRLVPLLQRSFPGVSVIGQEPQLYQGEISAQCALGDLGRYLRPDTQSFEAAAKGYLKVDQARTNQLRQRLRHDGRRIIGLSWASVNPQHGRTKSARLADFAPLLQLGDCRFIDLQYGDTRIEREQVARDTGLIVEHLDDVDNTNDIDGLAALMAACDAVVTVSNTNAHLAAAQGKPTFILLTDGGGLIWYWMKRGRTTPFYASARLFRQQAGQTWSDLAAIQVLPDLSTYLASCPD